MLETSRMLAGNHLFEHGNFGEALCIKVKFVAKFLTILQLHLELIAFSELAYDIICWNLVANFYKKY